MRRVMIAVAFAAALPAHADNVIPPVREMIRSFCADRWPADFVMQERCTAEQVRGYLSWVDFEGVFSDQEKATTRSRMSAELGAAWEQCNRRWIDDDGRFDFHMIVRCFGEQEAAWRRLNPS